MLCLYCQYNNNYYYYNIETLGLVAPFSSDFLFEVGRRLSAATGDICEMTFLFQRLSIAVQSYNFVLIYESFAAADVEPDN